MAWLWLFRSIVELQASNGCLWCHTVIDRSQFQKYIPSVFNARQKRREYHHNLARFYPIKQIVQCTFQLGCIQKVELNAYKIDCSCTFQFARSPAAAAQLWVSSLLQVVPHVPQSMYSLKCSILYVVSLEYYLNLRVCLYQSSSETSSCQLNNKCDSTFNSLHSRYQIEMSLTIV